MKKVSDILYLMWLMAIAWYLVTTFIFAIKNPDLSQMRVFLHTPKSFILNFDVEE